MPITAQRFVKSRRDDWQRLHALVDKAQRSRLTALTDEELHDMGVLYRQATADLARAQTRYATSRAGVDLVRSLNDLVLRAHTQVYSAPAPEGRRLWHFVLYGFPAAFRRQRAAIGLSALMLLLPALAAFCVVLFDPNLAHLFVPEMFIQGVKARAQSKGVAAPGAPGQWNMLLLSPALSSFIMTNNIYVAMRAVAFGVLFGLGTVRELAINGMLLGGLAGVASAERMNLEFWSLILPHGVLELSAIAIAGGAGLLLARALFAPGDLPRRDAIKVEGMEAARLMAGVAMLLVVAGTIEGFITPMPLPPALKLLVGCATGVGLVLYLSNRPRRV